MNLIGFLSRFEDAGDHEAVLTRFYRETLRIRLVEEEIAKRYADQEMRCPVHLSVGQEASAVGVCQALSHDDQAFSTHRCHAHYLAKGGDLKAMLAEIYGKAAGCVGGRGGSMHLMDLDAGLQASVPIVGSSIALATGFGLAEKRNQSGNIAVAFFGDACVEEGIFHESANFAALAKLPVLYVCENNLYSVYTPLSQRQPDRPLTDVAKAHNMAVWHGDGNDVLAAYEISCQAVRHVRQGNGPALIVLDTYRWREHCGPNFDNHIGYRTEDEFEHWRKLCPLSRLEQALDIDGRVDSTKRKAIAKTLMEEINGAFEAAKSAPLPKLEDAGRYVFAE